MADPFLQQMIDAGMVDDRMRLLMQSIQRGQALRATPSAQGMTVGQTYRASSPLEHLATAMSRYKGEKMIGEAEGQMGGLLDQKRQGRMAFAENPQPLAGALSGDPAMAAGGQVVLGQQAAQREGERFEKTFGAQEAARQAEAAHRAAALGETSRHNRATEGLTSQSLAAKAAEDAAKKAADAGKGTDDLRKEFQGLSAYKDFMQVDAAYKKVMDTSPHGPGDISLIFGYMKLVDPGSTVREGEFATAANSGAVPDKVAGLYNRVLKGEKLPPTVREQFRGEASKVYAAQKAQFDQVANAYRGYAKVRGYEPEHVIFGGQPEIGGGAAPGAPGPAAAGGDKKAARQALAEQMKAQGASATEILAAIKSQGLAE